MIIHSLIIAAFPASNHTNLTVTTTEIMRKHCGTAEASIVSSVLLLFYDVFSLHVITQVSMSEGQCLFNTRHILQMDCHENWYLLN